MQHSVYVDDVLAARPIEFSRRHSSAIHRIFSVVIYCYSPRIHEYLRPTYDYSANGLYFNFHHHFITDKTQ